MQSDEEVSAYFSWLIEEGGYSLSGVDEDGEIVYTPNMDRLKEIAPDLYEVLYDKTIEMLNEMIEQGVIEEDGIEWDETDQEYKILMTDAVMEFISDPRNS